MYRLAQIYEEAEKDVLIMRIQIGPIEPAIQIRKMSMSIKTKRRPLRRDEVLLTESYGMKDGSSLMIQEED
jgi:hypothetical protein